MAIRALLLTLPLLVGQAPRITEGHKILGTELGARDQDAFGKSVASLGDLDGDGVAELAVGANFDDDGAQDAGAVWILFRTSTEGIKRAVKISAGAGGFRGGLEANDLFGSAVACVGDLDGDGVVELAVGARDASDGAGKGGAVWILFLRPDGTVKSHSKIAEPGPTFRRSVFPKARFGCGLASLGDLNGDGTPDLAVGESQLGKGPGSVWILFLGSKGEVRSSLQHPGRPGAWEGLETNDLLGPSLACLPDLDGDGTVELAVGALGDDDGAMDAGAVWMLFLRSDGTVKARRKISPGSGGFRGELDERDLFGHSLVCVGDLDADGVPDLAVGAQGDDDSGPNRGALWILYLTREGTVRDHAKIGAQQRGLSDYDRLGRSMTTVRDSPSGPLLLVAGAPGDDAGGPGRGAVWILPLQTGDPAPR